MQQNGGTTRLFAGGTLSKALGGHGGIIPGDQALFDAVTTVAHLFDGASVPAAPVAAAAQAALAIVMAEPGRRQQLRHNVARMRAGLRALGIEVGDAPTPVVGFTCGDAAAMRQLHQQLAADGILVPYASAYSGLGPEGALRLAVFATHTEAMIDRLLAALERLLP
jgi:7-keto-8-aminopelargonate synthetase-like enzyme